MVKNYLLYIHMREPFDQLCMSSSDNIFFWYNLEINSQSLKNLKFQSKSETKFSLRSFWAYSSIIWGLEVVHRNWIEWIGLGLASSVWQ